MAKAKTARKSAPTPLEEAVETATRRERLIRGFREYEIERRRAKIGPAAALQLELI